MPPRKVTVVPVARRMPDGRLGIVEKHMSTEKRLSKAEQLAQATALMHRRLFDPNASIGNLAEEFGLAKETITSRLALARKDGVPDQAREIFIQEMLPMSMAVLMEALRGEDKKLAATIALKIVDGLKAMELPDEPKPEAGSDGDSFEIFRERIRVVRASDKAEVQAGSPEAAGSTIEVTPLPFARSIDAGSSSETNPPSTGESGSETGLETAPE